MAHGSSVNERDLCGFCREATNSSLTSLYNIMYIGFILLILTDLRKRKVLNAPACKVEAELLKRALFRCTAGSANHSIVWETVKNLSVYLCMKCQQILNKQCNLQEQLAKVNVQINNRCKVLIQSLNLLNPIGTTPTTTGSKRPASQDSVTNSQTTSVLKSPEVSIIVQLPKYLICLFLSF